MVKAKILRPKFQIKVAYTTEGGGSEPRIFLGAAVSHLEGTKTNQRAAVWESTGPPPWLRGGIWLYPDEHNQF